MTTYADLPRTKSGALTAESKRVLAADEAESRRLMHERFKKETDRREALAEMEEATQLYEAVTDYGDDTPQTEREERIIETALREHKVDVDALEEEAARDLYSDLRDTFAFESPVAEQIRRIKYLGLDSEKSTLEILEALLRAEEGDK